jgi:uncharacterized protein YceK
MKVLIVIICVVILAGCASLNYETKDGTKVSYFRLFTTADKIKGNVGTATIEVNNQKIDLEALQSVLSLMGVVK